MKNFFVIKKENGQHDFYDQYGYKMPYYRDIPDFRNAFFTSWEMGIMDVDVSSVDDPKQVNIIKFGFSLMECKDEMEIKLIANQQNNQR